MPQSGRIFLTSACMPDAQAQADKMAGVALGVAHGFTHFNMFPLCSDEAWSNVQVILDVEHVHTAWETLKPLTETQRAEEALNTLTLSLQENRIQVRWKIPYYICGEITIYHRCGEYTVPGNGNKEAAPTLFLTPRPTRKS